jgi:outer membrane protein OmpA-like peptidoglycan-associated protein
MVNANENKRRMRMRPCYVRMSVWMSVLLFFISGCNGMRSSLPVSPQRFEKVTLHLYFIEKESKLHEKDHAKLDSIVDLIKSYPGASVMIEGHTDNSGGRDENHTLSHKRADAVKHYMIYTGGLDESRIDTIGYGESRPIASNKTAAGREQNRRVVILIKPR